MPPTPEETPKTPPKKGAKALALSWLPYLLIPILAYFVNVEIQSYLGRQAQKAVDLPSLALPEAMKAAAQENKHILVDMSAIWCPTCRKLDQQIFADPRVQERIQQHYIFSRIEYETPEGKRFMEQYQISGFPTLLLLDAHGKKLRRLPLTFSVEEFLTLITPAS